MPFKSPIIAFALFLFTFQSEAQWSEINVNTTSDILGVSFYGNRILAVSNNTLHFSTNSGNSWSNVVLSNPTENAYFRNVNFTDSSHNENTSISTGVAYVIGSHAPTQTAVIYKIDLSNPSSGSRIYTGLANSKLNDIANWSGNSHIAVGDNGLIVTIENDLPYQLNLNIPHNLIYVDFKNQDKKLLTDNSLVYTLLGDQSDSWNYSFPFFITSGSPKVFANLYGITYYAGLTFFQESSGNLTDYNSYYGNINANDIIERGNALFIASRDGIYKTTTTNRRSVERQVSSIPYNVNKIVQGSNETGVMYAACNNGKLLFSSNSGGNEYELYTEIVNDNGCAGSDNIISLKRGSATSGEWSVDGTITSNNSFSTTINSAAAGTYIVEFRGMNSIGLPYIITKDIIISDEPQNLPVTLQSSSICASEGAVFTIPNAEPNVFYELRKLSDNTILGTSSVGNGVNLVFTSNRIFENGIYYLRAINALSGCSVNTSNSYNLTIENTTANFNSGTVNAYLNEPVTIFENTIDTDSYSYGFPSSASITTSTLPNPVISFSGLGAQSISLTATSNAGCSDTITDVGPNVIALPTTTSDCFNFVIETIDRSWNGSYNPDISKMRDTGDGFIIGGYINNSIIPSLHGKNIPLINETDGIFIAKYDYYGTLKWYTYTENRFSQRFEDEVHDFDLDSQGNIIVAMRTYGDYIDARGKRLKATQGAIPSQLKNYMIKLSPKGELIWNSEIKDFSGFMTTSDTNDNILIVGQLSNDPSTPRESYLNQNLVSTLNFTFGSHVHSNYYGIIKMDAQGAILWNKTITLDRLAYLNDESFLETDSNNNILFSYRLREELKVHNQTNNQSFTVTNNANISNYLGRAGIIKLDSSGIVQNNYSDYTNDIFGFAINSQNEVIFQGVKENAPDYSIIGKLDSSLNLIWLKETDRALVTRPLHISIDSNDDILSAGIVRKKSSQNSSSVRFLGIGSNYVEVPNNTTSSTTYIARYTTIGDIVQVLTDGNTNFGAFKNSYSGYRHGISGLFKNTNNDYFLAENIKILSYSVGPYFRFSEPMPPSFRSYDGMVSKFNLNCATVYDAALSTTDALQKQLVLYPNPTNSYFTIDTDIDAPASELRFIDLLGKTVKVVKPEINQNTFKAPPVSGIYILQVTFEDSLTIFAKLIVN